MESIQLYVRMLLLLVCVCFQTTKSAQPWEHKGSTPFLKELIIGRCHEYLQLSRTNQLPAFTINVDCKEVWNRFRSAWAGKDNCAVKASDYNDFISIIHNDKSVKDKLLFYSGVQRLTQDFTQANENYVTLERTISGFIGNDLDFCGCTEESKTCVEGISYDTCKKCGEGVKDAKYIFWEVASRDFAKRSSGVTYVMLNGSKNGDQKAYHDRSFFKNYELPEISKLGRQGVVRKLVIFVVSDLDRKLREGCRNSDGSVTKLIQDARKQGIKKVRCYDEPRMIVNILCAKSPKAKECRCPKRKIYHFLVHQKRRIQGYHSLDGKN